MLKQNRWPTFYAKRKDDHLTCLNFRLFVLNSSSSSCRHFFQLPWHQGCCCCAVISCWRKLQAIIPLLLSTPVPSSFVYICTCTYVCKKLRRREVNCLFLDGPHTELETIDEHFLWHTKKPAAILHTLRQKEEYCLSEDRVNCTSIYFL